MRLCDVERPLVIVEVANGHDSPRLGREPAVRVQSCRACRASCSCVTRASRLTPFAVRRVDSIPPGLSRAINPSRIAIARGVLRASHTVPREYESKGEKRGKVRRRRTLRTFARGTRGGRVTARLRQHVSRPVVSACRVARRENIERRRSNRRSRRLQRARVIERA